MIKNKELSTIRKRMEKIDRNRLSRIKEARDTRNFKVMIQNWAAQKEEPKVLSSEQRQAIYYLADFTHNYSNDWIAEKLLIPIHELSKWRNTPLFIRELDKEITRRKSYIRLHAFRNVHRAILRGDMKSTWNYLKMSGDLKENIHITDTTGMPNELTDQELQAEIDSLNQKLNAANRNIKKATIPSQN